MRPKRGRGFAQGGKPFRSYPVLAYDFAVGALEDILELRYLREDVGRVDRVELPRDFWSVGETGFARPQASDELDLAGGNFRSGRGNRVRLPSRDPAANGEESAAIVRLERDELPKPHARTLNTVSHVQHTFGARAIVAAGAHDGVVIGGG